MKPHLASSNRSSIPCDEIRADMHIHTCASDGLLTCEEVVNTARNAGLKMLAVTDHDTTFNTQKLNTFCQNAGIIGVNGIEVSAYDGNLKVHTLGYGFDLNNAQFNSFLGELYEGSIKRAEQIIFKLNTCGINLTFEDAAAERLSDKSPVHVMHIARAAVKKRFAQNPFTFYKQYLAVGAPAFSNICRPSPERAIEAINGAGGLAVIAHPGRIELPKSELYALISRLASAGLGGIEGVYSSHTAKETAYFKEIAEEFGLLTTGGSDTHFLGGNRAIGNPVFYPSDELRQRLKI